MTGRDASAEARLWQRIKGPARDLVMSAALLDLAVAARQVEDVRLWALRVGNYVEMINRELMNGGRNGRHVRAERQADRPADGPEDE